MVVGPVNKCASLEAMVQGPGPGWARLRGKGNQGYALYVLSSSHVNEVSQIAMPGPHRGEMGKPTQRASKGSLAHFHYLIRWRPPMYLR